MAREIAGGPTRRGVVAGGGIAAALALTAAPRSARAARDNVVRHAVAADHINSLDPSIVSQNADANASRQVFDALIDPPDGTFDLGRDQIVHEAAEELDISKDSRTYTVKLREGMLFHKGYGEVTAADAKFTFDRLGPKGNSSYRVLYADMDEVKQLDKYRIQITLRRPDPQFYATCMLSRGAGIVCKAAVEKLGDGFRRAPVGSGPFEFVTIDGDRGVVLKRFEQYYREKAKLDGLEYRYVGDASARTLGFLKGDLDMIEGARLPGWTDDLAKQMPSAKFDLTKPGSTNVLFFNMTRKPFDDIRVRKAIRLATDRKVFADAFGALYGDVWGVNPPDFPGALQKADVPEELRYDDNVKAAKQLLAEAGFPNGFAFDNQISQREDYSSIMLVVQELLRRINVNMRLQTVDHTAYPQQLRQGRCHLPDELLHLRAGRHANAAELFREGCGGDCDRRQRPGKLQSLRPDHAGDRRPAGSNPERARPRPSHGAQPNCRASHPARHAGLERAVAVLRDCAQSARGSRFRHEGVLRELLHVASADRRLTC